MKYLITGGSGFIGTNLVSYYLERNETVMNLDIKPPRNVDHYDYWIKCDLRDYIQTRKLIFEYKPDYIIHMAAETGLLGKNIADYSANTQGVENLLKICNELINLNMVVFASTMLVCKAGYQPKTQDDYCPNTLYGESKKIGEEIIKNFETNFNWAIVRPTSIWGPWFGRTYREFFEMIISKKYFNFTGKMCTKTYGYIGNVVYQIDAILNTKQSNKKTYYVGDYTPTRVDEWAKEIASEFGFKIYTIPYLIVKITAFFGDILLKFGIRFPMNSFRLSNMTTDNILDLSETERIAPEIKFSRKEGNKLTLAWMKTHYKPELFTIH